MSAAKEVGAITELTMGNAGLSQLVSLEVRGVTQVLFYHSFLEDLQERLEKVNHLT